MKVIDKNIDEISDQEIELTRDQIHELKRRIKDHDSPVRYVIYSEIIPKGRWRLFLNISDDTWCDDINTATLFKREHIAKVIIDKYSERGKGYLYIAKLTTKNNKRKVLKYFR